MSTVNILKRFTVEEYLELEKQGELRHELVDGQVYAMVGASAVHNLIAATLLTILSDHLKDSSCQVFISDMKLRVEDAFYYPDLFVTCEKFDAKSVYLTSPMLVVEILSESTEARDRLEKRIAYQHLDSIQEYVLISQNKAKVEIFRRLENAWEVETYSYGDIVNFRSVSLDIPIEQIYKEVMNFIN